MASINNEEVSIDGLSKEAIGGLLGNAFSSSLDNKVDLFISQFEEMQLTNSTFPQSCGAHKIGQALEIELALATLDALVKLGNECVLRASYSKLYFHLEGSVLQDPHT